MVLETTAHYDLESRKRGKNSEKWKSFEWGFVRLKLSSNIHLTRFKSRNTSVGHLRQPGGRQSWCICQSWLNVFWRPPLRFSLSSIFQWRRGLTRKPYTSLERSFFRLSFSLKTFDFVPPWHQWQSTETSSQSSAKLVKFKFLRRPEKKWLGLAGFCLVVFVSLSTLVW